MKKAYYLILLFSVGVFGFSSAQFVNYMDDSGWNLGFNLGGTWQEKEAFTIGNEAVFMQPFTSLKGGFTFGKTVFYIPKNRFSLRPFFSGPRFWWFGHWMAWHVCN